MYEWMAGIKTWTVVRRAVVAVGSYAIGYLLTALVFVMSEGIEGDPNRVTPYMAVFGVLYGAALRWWWVLPFPALHEFVVQPVWNDLRYSGPVYYSYDRWTPVLAATLGIAAGVVLGRLLRPARKPRSR
jgi:hypothetical protein